MLAVAPLSAAAACIRRIVGKNGSGKTVRAAASRRLLEPRRSPPTGAHARTSRRPARAPLSRLSPHPAHRLSLSLPDHDRVPQAGDDGRAPPNCRGGQAFINDPNALGTSEVRNACTCTLLSCCWRWPGLGVLSIASCSLPHQVKGQIKLRFTSANKRPAVCTRSFSLTQKPQKREYKAFECALKTITDEGKQVSLSYKASDLNKEVTEMMGVSTAVLDSVIFVHQEDSCWPLSEDKVLKQKVRECRQRQQQRTRQQRSTATLSLPPALCHTHAQFDDIFAATEYTKALDSIKAYRLDKSKDIRGLAAELETLQTRLDTATRLRNDQADAEKMLKELNEGIDQAVSGIQDAKQAARAKASIDERDTLRGKHSQNCQEHANAQNASACAGDVTEEL